MAGLPAQPDLDQVLACAKRIASRAGDHGVSDRDLLDTIEEILVWRKQGWECARLGILTRDELSNLLLAHLDSLVLVRCGRRFFDPHADDTVAMRAALFGD